MRNLIMRSAVLAILAGLAMPSFGQDPTDGTVKKSQNTGNAFAKLEATPTDIRVDGPMRVRWAFDPIMVDNNATTINLDLMVGGRPCELKRDVRGLESSDGWLTALVSLAEVRFPEAITARTPVKLRATVMVNTGQVRPSPFFKEIDIALLPANRAPIGTLGVIPAEADGNTPVSVNGSISDPDGDQLQFKILKHVTTTGRWEEVASGNSLPLNLVLDPSGSAPVQIEYKLVASDRVETGVRSRELELPFNITLRALPSAPPVQAPSHAPDPSPPEAPLPPHLEDSKPTVAPVHATPAQGDPAPVASNHAPTDLSVQITPNPVRAGERFVIVWAATDADNGDILRASLEVRTAAGWEAIAGVTSVGNTFTGAAPANRTSECFHVSLRLTVTDRAGASTNGIYDLAVQPAAAPAASTNPVPPVESAGPAAVVRPNLGDPPHAGQVMYKWVYNKDTAEYTLEYDTDPRLSRKSAAPPKKK